MLGQLDMHLSTHGQTSSEMQAALVKVQVDYLTISWVNLQSSLEIRMLLN